MNPPRSAVVTGAGEGIGRAVCTKLAEDGWDVVAVDVDGRRLEGVLGAVPGSVGVVGDVAQIATHDRAVAAASSRSPLHGWVNNAGLTSSGPLHRLDVAVMQEMIDVNLGGTILGTRAVLAEFVATGTPGAIVNVSSIHASGPFPGAATYAATKGAIEALTRAVCVEYGHLGVRCNAVAPGGVLTERNQRQLDDAADPDALLREWHGYTPAGRLLEPAEVADTISFLLSDWASGINGVVLAVDGGASARHVAVVSDAAFSEGSSP